MASSASRFDAKPLASPTATTLNDWPVLSATTIAVTATLRKKTPAAPTIVATKITYSSVDVPRTNSQRYEPIRVGSTTPAWFAAVPYQGTRPRTSRSSVVPRSATHPAATGPPSVIAARIGAIETETRVPRGILTGSAPAKRVTTVQNASPINTNASDALSGLMRDLRPHPEEPIRRLRSRIRKDATRIHKTREQERSCAYTHESCDVQLQGPGHRYPIRVASDETLNPPSLLRTSPVVLEALERGSSGQGHRGHRTDEGDKSDDSMFHRSDLRLKALGKRLKLHARTSFGGPRVLGEHENRPDTVVGRLHYSLSSTLSAHFRWGVRASERLNVAS